MVEGPAGAWRPLLAGRQRAAAEAALGAIATELRSLPLLQPGAAGAADPSLASGASGIALFHTYWSLARADEGRAHEDAALDHLERAIDALGEVVTPPSLFSGHAGVAWTAAHLAARLGLAGCQEATTQVDESLLLHLAEAQPAPFDLLEGWTGLGVYGLERLPDATGTDLLSGVVERLSAAAETDAEGVTWFSSPAFFPQQDREAYPGGYYNLGMAHGLPGVIALLARVGAAGVHLGTARRLLHGAVDWLLARRLAGTEGALFAYHHRAGEPPRAARLGWCYGDAGIALALLGAARAAGEPRWVHEARVIAARAAGRDAASARVVDAGLCHGACGLGHLFNRFHQATGDPVARQAACAWFERGLAMRRPGTGVGGFSALLPGPGGEPQVPAAEPGFLTGAAGIGLALLAATSEVEPSWDRVLLADLAPAADPVPAAAQPSVPA
jgi:hypothetical protein